MMSGWNGLVTPFVTFNVHLIACRIPTKVIYPAANARMLRCSNFVSYSFQFVGVGVCQH